MSIYHRQLMIVNALKKSGAYISYPGLVAAWDIKKEGKDNDHPDRGWLRDLTVNGHDIELINFLYAEMSGYGGFKDNMLNWSYNKNSAVIKRTSNKFIIYNTEQVNTHFWKYISNPPLGTFYYPSYKLKITGLPEDKFISYLYHTENDFNNRTEQRLYNGINTIPEINFEVLTENLGYKTIFEYTNIPNNCEITFELTPLYPGALMFDGKDDRGLSKNYADKFNFHNDYSLIFVGSVLSKTAWGSIFTGLTDSVNVSNSKLQIDGVASSESSYIRALSNKNLYTNNLKVNKNEKLIICATYNSERQELLLKDMINGLTPLILKNVPPKNDFTDLRFILGTKTPFAFYASYFFDRSLDDEQEIKAFIRKYIDPEYLLPSEIPNPDCYYDFSLGSSQGATREDIVDQSGNGKNAKAHNFSWKQFSGYDGYYLTSNGTATITKVQGTGNILGAFHCPSNTNMTITIAGIPEGATIVSRASKGEHFRTNKDGTYHIGPFEGAVTIAVFDFVGECNIQITEEPQYKGALVFDGADDYISLDAFDSGFKTIFMKFKPIKSINAGFYDQIKKEESKYYFAVAGGSTDIAFTYRNTNGKTYINGTLNTSILSKDIIDKTICVGIVNENVTADNTVMPKIGNGTHFEPWFANMAIYKFLGFKEALTEEQVKAIIKKYNLLDGVDEIEVS